MTKKAIGLTEYDQLTEEEQMDILHRDGVYVGKRKEAKQTVVLFQLYSFYVEVHYKQYRKKIDHTVSTSNPEILQPYINQINVRGIDNAQD